MKKLATADPQLTYPERKALLAEFVPDDLTADNDVAAYIEKSGEGIEAFVQSVRDQYCSTQILSWA